MGLRDLLTSDTIDHLRDPRWGEASPVQDWRNHIPIQLMDIWDELPLEAQATAYLVADQHAALEEFDYP